MLQDQVEKVKPCWTCLDPDERVRVHVRVPGTEVYMTYDVLHIYSTRARTDEEGYCLLLVLSNCT